MKGHGAIFLVDGMELSAPRGAMPQMAGQPEDWPGQRTRLDDLLEKYGFEDRRRLRLRQAERAGAHRRRRPQMLRTRPCSRVQLPSSSTRTFGAERAERGACSLSPARSRWSGPLAERQAEPGARLWTLAATSPEAWKQTGFFFFAPMTNIEEGEGKTRPLRARLRLPGHAEERVRPGGAARDVVARPAGRAAVGVEEARPDWSSSATPTSPSDEYLQLSRFLPVYQGGAQMLFNAISWTMEDEALTPVRTKTVASRPIDARVRQHGGGRQGRQHRRCPADLHRLRAGAPRRSARPSPGSKAMNRKTLLAFGAFVVLGIVAFLAVRAPEKGERAADRARPIPALDAAQITTVDITKGGVTSTLKKEGDTYRVDRARRPTPRTPPTPRRSGRGWARWTSATWSRIRLASRASSRSTTKRAFTSSPSTTRRCWPT